MKVCVLGAEVASMIWPGPADKFGHEVVVVPGNAGDPWSSAEEPADSDLYVLGSDGVVCSGQGDRLRGEGRLVFGPNAEGAQLEGSKQWMKELLVTGGVPTARHAIVTNIARAEAFLRTLPGAYVVKTDYLALGKGVLVTEDLDEAISDARSKLEHGAVVIDAPARGSSASGAKRSDLQRADCAADVGDALSNTRGAHGIQGRSTCRASPTGEMTSVSFRRRRFEDGER